MFYQPGDIYITEFFIVSPRGYYDLSHAFVSAKVYESIFNPGIILIVNVLDTDDNIGTIKLLGDEQIKFTFQAPGGVFADYTLNVESIVDNIVMGSQKSKIYTLNCVSPEALHSKSSYIQKSYNMTIGDMIKDIHTNFLKSTLPLNIEETKGTQKIIVPNLTAFHAIDMLRRRSVSDSNQSSTFAYWATYAGFNYKTIEGLFKQGPIKTFKQEDTVGASIYSRTDNNIIAYNLNKVASSMDRINDGALNQRTATFNFRTLKYEYKDTKPNEEGTFGGTGNYNSDFFKAVFGQTYSKFSFIPLDTAEKPNTNIPESTSSQLSYISDLTQSYMTIKVPGDAIVKAGDIINCIIPNKVSTTGNIGQDVLVSGNFLVSRICRNIDIASVRPRYTDTIECVKGKLNGEGV